MTLLLFSKAWGKLIHQKNLKQKILRHCHFNVIHFPVRSVTYSTTYDPCCKIRRTNKRFSILFCSILFYFILFYSILFYSIILYSILFYSILFPVGKLKQLKNKPFSSKLKTLNCCCRYSLSNSHTLYLGGDMSQKFPALN